MIKFIGVKQEKNLWDLGLSKDFLYLTPKAQSMTGKTDKMDAIKIKNFSSVKDPIKRIKTQHTD